jgi:hypothetical protein
MKCPLNCHLSEAKDLLFAALGDPFPFGSAQGHDDNT